jgi:hypothetical protein
VPRPLCRSSAQDPFLGASQFSQPLGVGRNHPHGRGGALFTFGKFPDHIRRYPFPLAQGHGRGFIKQGAVPKALKPLFGAIADTALMQGPPL